MDLVKRADNYCKKSKIESGFTLIEIIVALALIGLTISVVIQLFSASLKTVTRSESYVYASIKAESAMRSLLAEDKLKEGGDSKVDREGYRVESTITEVEEDRTKDLNYKLLQIDLTCSWTEGEKNYSIHLSSLKAVNKELDNVQF